MTSEEYLMNGNLRSREIGQSRKTRELLTGTQPIEFVSVRM